jgi:transcriptional regulator with XRE-family HTH domain
MKLRALRTQKRLTLARLAAETGLSTALLSKLETDRMIPTLPTLATISRVYGVGMSYFFKEPSRHTLSITRKAQLVGQDRGTEQLRKTPLNAVGEGSLLTDPENSGKGPKLVAQLIEFPAGGLASISDGSQEVNGLVYVLEGKLQLDSGGLQETIEEGDCVYVESDMTLSWSAVGKHRCRVLAVSPGAPAAKES